MRGTAVRTGITRLTLVLQVLSLAGVAPTFGAVPRAVSPGGAARFVAAAAACPTFSWAALPGSSEVELVVYAVIGEADVALASQPALRCGCREEPRRGRLPRSIAFRRVDTRGRCGGVARAWARETERQIPRLGRRRCCSRCESVRRRRSSRARSTWFAATWRVAESWQVRLRLRLPRARIGGTISAANRQKAAAQRWHAASRPTCPSASRARQGRSRTWCWAARRWRGSRPRTSGASPTTPCCSTFTTPARAP